MDKTTIVKRIKTLLSIDTQLESYTLDDGTVFQADSLDVGNVLYLVTPDGVLPADAGEYVFGDWTVKVGEEGMIEESTQAESPAAAAAAEEPAEVEAEETPEEPEADPEPDVAPVVSLEEHNALVQRITDLEEVVETLTDALSEFRLQTPAVEAAEEDPKPASKVVEVEFQEKPKNPRGNSTVDKVFNRINKVQFADA